MSIICPVCQGPLQQSVTNILFCGPRKTTFPTLNTILEMSHATLFFDEKEKLIYQHLIIDKYAFKIYDDDQQQKTVILRLQKKEKTHFGYGVSRVKEFEWKELLTIPAVVTLSWHNKKRVVDCVKTYLVFS